jgi:hypothetical protein
LLEIGDIELQENLLLGSTIMNPITITRVSVTEVDEFFRSWGEIADKSESDAGCGGHRNIARRGTKVKSHRSNPKSGSQALNSGQIPMEKACAQASTRQDFGYDSLLQRDKLIRLQKIASFCDDS